jgi:hypothetical protein
MGTPAPAQVRPHGRALPAHVKPHGRALPPRRPAYQVPHTVQRLIEKSAPVVMSSVSARAHTRLSPVRRAGGRGPPSAPAFYAWKVDAVESGPQPTNASQSRRAGHGVRGGPERKRALETPPMCARSSTTRAEAAACPRPAPRARACLSVRRPGRGAGRGARGGAGREWLQGRGAPLRPRP